MKILAIDAATPLEIIAACSEHAAAEAISLVSASHSAALINAIDRCLKKAGIALIDLECIGVGVGPGSFTGVRIAVSTARMLAQVLNLPLIGIRTHLLYAVSVDASEGDNILIAFDAKKGRVFGALYRKSDDDLTPVEIVAPGDYEIGRLLEGVDASRPTHMTGSGVEKYRESAEKVGKRIILDGFAPSGRAICALFRKTYLASPDAFDDYNRVVPFYARKSDAETAKESRRSG